MTDLENHHFATTNVVTDIAITIREVWGKKGLYITGLRKHMEHLGPHSEVVTRMKSWA